MTPMAAPDQTAYWNRVAESKDFRTPFRLDLFLRHVSSGARIVDVGCGYGRTLRTLQEAGFTRLIGVDRAARMIARGRRLFPGLDLRCNTAGSLPFDDGCCDAVLLLAVLTGIIDDREQDRLLADIGRILVDGGILYINDFLLNSDARNLARYRRGRQRFGRYGVFELPDGAVFRHHDEAHLRALTRGFTPLAFEPAGFSTMNGNRARGITFIGAKHSAGQPCPGAKESDDHE